MQDKIFNSNFDNVEYGRERTTNETISINPAAADMYEETTTKDIENLYTNRALREKMFDLYQNSDYYKKYKQDPRKVDRGDTQDIYYYFKDRLSESGEYTIVQIFCTIAEFFDFNYKTLYQDVITLEDKVKLMDALKDMYGLEKELNPEKQLF